jgi:integrase
MATRENTGRLHLLSARQVQAATDGDHADGGGLVLRVRDGAGSAAWVLRYTAPSGRRREMGLGPLTRESLVLAGKSLAAARELAHGARQQVKAGVDPLEYRHAKRAAAREAEAQRKAAATAAHWTLARCARDYHERVVEPNRTVKHGAQWLQSLENHISPAIWHSPIAEVTPPALLSVLEAATPHERARNHRDLGETLRRVRQRLDCVFEDAMFYGRCTSNPAAAVKRKLHEIRPRAKRGMFRALPYREAPQFMRQLRAEEGTAARCLELLMLTIARTDEAISALPREFDLERAEWLVPADRMKGGEEHLVYLVPRALAIVKRQLEFNAPIMFPSPLNDGRALSNMALLAVLDRMGMRARTTVHGLRSTFSTWANETGAARPDVIEACLAHKESDRVRAAYNRAQFADERRALLVAWAAFLDTPSAVVLPLRAA